MTRKKHLLIAVIILIIVFYIVFINILVSAALVPSFMEKLDAFEDITNESLEQQVHSDTISTNTKLINTQTKEWLDTITIDYKEITSADGYRLVASQIMQENVSHQWLLTLHGYTGWKEELYPYAMPFYERGYNVFSPDLRCQGDSEGDFIGMGWTDKDDVLLWIDLILKEDSEAEIVILGQSMGAACALMLSGMDSLPSNVIAIISDCAYTSAYEMFEKQAWDWFHLPAFPFVDSCNLALQLRGGYDLKDASAINAVAKSKVPILFIHGTDDKMIPSSMCQELYETCSSNKEILLIPNAGHAQAMYADPNTYWNVIWTFLSR